MIKKEHIINTLKTCYDPEIPIDLWNLGLIYDIKMTELVMNAFPNTEFIFKCPICNTKEASIDNTDPTTQQNTHKFTTLKEFIQPPDK